jgi:hypothetical protein
MKHLRLLALIAFFTALFPGVIHASYSPMVENNAQLVQNTAQPPTFLFNDPLGDQLYRYAASVEITVAGVGCSAGAGVQVVVVWTGVSGTYQTAILAQVGVTFGNSAGGQATGIGKKNNGLYYVVNILGTCTTNPTYHMDLTVEKMT